MGLITNHVAIALSAQQYSNDKPPFRACSKDGRGNQIAGRVHKTGSTAKPNRNGIYDNNRDIPAAFLHKLIFWYGHHLTP